MIYGIQEFSYWADEIRKGQNGRGHEFQTTDINQAYCYCEYLRTLGYFNIDPPEQWQVKERPELCPT